MKSVGLFLKKKWQESLPKRFQVLLKNQGFIPNTNPLPYIFYLCLDVSVYLFPIFPMFKGQKDLDNDHIVIYRRGEVFGKW